MDTMREVWNFVVSIFSFFYVRESGLDAFLQVFILFAFSKYSLIFLGALFIVVGIKANL